MTDTELKPCPFCGGEAYVRKHDNKRKTYSVECLDSDCVKLGQYQEYECSCCSPVTVGDYCTEEAAIKAWNTRA